MVFGNCIIKDHAKILGNNIVAGNTVVFGNAVVKDRAGINGHSLVYGHAMIKDSASITHEASVSGYTVVGANAWLEGHASISRNIFTRLHKKKVLHHPDTIEAYDYTGPTDPDGLFFD